jgi:hypothetical protein
MPLKYDYTNFPHTHLWTTGTQDLETGKIPCLLRTCFLRIRMELNNETGQNAEYINRMNNFDVI